MGNFWKAALNRAVRTMAQTAVAMIPVGAMIQQLDVVTIASTSVVAGLLSILTSVATDLPEVKDE